MKHLPSVISRSRLLVVSRRLGLVAELVVRVVVVLLTFFGAGAALAVAVAAHFSAYFSDAAFARVTFFSL